MTTDTDTVITLSDVTKTYAFYRSPKDRLKEVFHPFQKKYHERFHALNRVSFSIRKGETVGLLGRNGSGKSTLLQLVCGISPPSIGKVETRGRISALLELGAGFNPEFSGRENVYINAAIMGLRDDEIDRRFADIVSFSEIGAFIDKPVKTYSSGMYVRLAFSIAISVNPDILIIDEALSVGDLFFQSKCYRKFREFQEKGVTILFVTHDMDAITRYCQRAFLLDQGEIRASGDPKSVIDEYHRLIVGFAGTKDSVKGIKEGEGVGGEPPSENRYGDGRALITHAGIYTMDGCPAQQLVHGEIYDFRARVSFNAQLTSPVISFTIKDPKGFNISGTNTLYKNVDTGEVREKDVIEAVFRHRMILNPGEYLLSFGCAGFENNAYVVYDRRFDLLSFQVVSFRQSVGVFDLNSEVTLHRPGS